MLKKLTALMMALTMMTASAAALAEEPCPLAREKGPDYVVHYVQNTPIEEEWFLDAELIGDSITDSLADYDVMETLTIDALIGQSPQGAYNNRSMRVGDQFMTMLDVAIMRNPKKLMIMLGSNGLDLKRVEQVAADYHTLLDKVLVALPDTEVYLLSITPVRRRVADAYPNLTMDNIWRFNDILLAMAEEHGVHFMDITTPLAGEDRLILEEYCTGDGAHLKPAGAQAVMDAIRLQVIPD